MAPAAHRESAQMTGKIGAAGKEKTNEAPLMYNTNTKQQKERVLSETVQTGDGLELGGQVSGPLVRAVTGAG